ncbi:MAG: hypothetical protein WDZ53_04685 [Balneolales bacterium]
MQNKSNKIKALKEIIRHNHSKEVSNREIFDKVNALPYKDKDLYRREASKEVGINFHNFLSENK